jgi:dephospho-CoA kinase
MTGGIGSGKTAVSDRLKALGAAVVDTDVIARELTGPNGAAMAPIAKVFGEGVIAPDGSLDRAHMRARAFADPNAKRQLESILHPVIRKRAYELVDEAIAPYVVLVVPLLLETAGYRDIADRVLVVDCPAELQIERTMKRSGLAREEVERILATQTSRAARLAAATDVIVNDSGLDRLVRGVDELHAHFLALANDKAKRTMP